MLTLSRYREIGGVRGALAKQAEATYHALPTQTHQELARSLFLRLIDPGGGASFRAGTCKGSDSFPCRSGPPVQRIDLFDPTAQQIVVVPRVVGGRTISPKRQ